MLGEKSHRLTRRCRSTVASQSLTTFISPPTRRCPLFCSHAVNTPLLCPTGYVSDTARKLDASSVRPGTS